MSLSPFHLRRSDSAWLPRPMLILFTVLSGCNAAPRPEPALALGLSPDDLDSAKASFYQAISGDRDALLRATAFFENAYQQDPDLPVVTAYLGACRLLNAAAALWPWEKGRLAKAGVVLLDQAVAATPDDLEVRFLRGMTSYRLPEFMGRREVATTDLAQVASRASQAVQDGRLPPALATAALYHHGLILEENGDRSSAMAAWKEAATLDPTTPGGQAAFRRLQSLGRP